MTHEERTGWRDEKLSLRHRDWGLDCPMVDIDFLVVEYDHAKPKALVEYKHEEAKLADPKDANYRTLKTLAYRAKIPFFGVRYTGDLLTFTVVPLNRLAKGKLPERREMSEVEYVSFLYLLRGRDLPLEIREQLNE